MKSKSIINLVIALLFTSLYNIIAPCNSLARTTSVTGGVGVGYDFWERTYENVGETDSSGETIQDDNTGDRRQWGAWPQIVLETSGIHDTLTLRYAPVFVYNEMDTSTELDHYLALSGRYALKQHWNIWLTNNFILSDDPARYSTPFETSSTTSSTSGSEEEQAEEVTEPITTQDITRNLGRRRFWSNHLSMGTDYTYAENSTATIGYSNRMLRNVDSDEIDIGYSESDRHDFMAGLSYQFSRPWRIDTEFHYIQGLFDEPQSTPDGLAPQPVDDAIGEEPIRLNESEDLDEYNARLRLDYTKSVRDTFPLVYTFIGTEYEEDTRQDTWAHELTLGWDHAIDQHTLIIIGGGPSYVNSEDLEGEWDYNFYLRFTKAYQHANLTILIDKRYDTRNFTGSSSDNGLADTTSARADFTYQFTENLSSNIFAAYTHTVTVDPQGEYLVTNADLEEVVNEESVGDITSTRQDYSAGASLDYTFLRWYTATIRYAYYKQDGDLPRDEYNDHRLTFLLSMNHDLWP